MARQYKNPGTKPTSGNSTDARGKPTRVRLRISDEAGKKLNRAWKARSLEEPGITEDEIVNDLIMQMPEPIEDNEVEPPPSTDASAPFDAFRELRAGDGEKPIIL